MSDNIICDAASRDECGAASACNARDKILTVTIAGRNITGNVKFALDELAFEHYPVSVDAGDGEKVFPSFDAAREYLQCAFEDAD